uniref:AlNc14C134G7042 protein n=1 Tax=Albugo laibachii Nc14 TaxID=890382 RepID=F0WKJ0_9STRA|nr:AlNc14C134G7042 [Albugo laibachii Nc14]|eukprot:CCA21796.1 AlNc14C134G7042 [Albugo laibachii Nc14]
MGNVSRSSDDPCSTDRKLCGFDTRFTQVGRAIPLLNSFKYTRMSSSLGTDLLPAASHQEESKTFGEFLKIVFESQLQRGSLLRSQRQSATILLSKKGSRSEPGDHRPIAFLCLDVKGISKV